MIELKKIFLLPLFFLLCLLSCEEPDDPVIPYESSLTKSIGKTITSVDILWEELPFNNFDRYEIYYRKYFESEYKLYLTVTNQNQLYTTISGLTPNTEYKIYVNTIAKDGKTYTSKEITEKTLSDIPSAISKFVISDYSFNFATLLWSEYQDSYAVPFDRYEMYIGSTYDFVCTDSLRSLVIYDMSIYEATITKLVDKQGYYFKLRVYNKLGKYSESFPSYLKTPNAPPKPVELYPAENISESSVTLRWQKCNDPEFQKYDIIVANNVEFRPYSFLTSITSAGDTSIQVSDLKKGKAYVYKVAVYDKYFDFAMSNFTGFHAYMDGLPIPSDTTILQSDPLTSEITVRWNRSDLALFARYDIYSSTDSLEVVSSKGTVVTSDMQTKTYYTFTNLKRATKYYFKVAVVDYFSKQSYSPVSGIYLP